MLRHLVFSVFYLMSICASAQSNALDFDGSNDYVEVANGSAGIASSTPMSMTFWVYPTNSGPSFPNFDGFAGFRNESSADFYILHLSSTSVEARFRNSAGTNYDIVGAGVTRNQWQHYALTYDGSTMALYRNGALVSSRTASGAITSASETLYLGLLKFQNTNFQLDGKIDDFSLWSEGLSAAQVECIYKYGIDTSDTGLEIYYSFDQGRAASSNNGLDSLVDQKNGRNGELKNFRLSGSSSNWVDGVDVHTYIDGNICVGDSLLFNGVYRKEEGRYSEKYGVSSGCDSIVQLILTIHDADTNRPSERICAGDSVEVGGKYFKDEGVYTESFTSQYGCDSTTILTLDVDTVNVEIKNSNVLVSLALNALYQWYDCDGDSIIPGETGQTFGYADHGTYAVIVTQNGCTDTSECLYTALSVQEFGPMLAKVYPNPVENQLNIEFGAIQHNGLLKVFGTSGQLVYKTNVNNTNRVRLDMGGLKSGVYLLDYTNDLGRFSQRITVQ